MNNRVIVLWSGGYDSTAALLSALEDDNNDEVVAVQIGLECNTNQMEMERIAADEIYSRLVDKYSNKLHFRRIKMNIVRNGPFVGFVQPPTWALGLAFALNESEQFNYLYSGYIAGDDFWHIKSSFENCVTENLNTIGGNSKIKEFFYPLEWYTKKQVFDYIKAKQPNILKYVRTCERPIKRKDGKYAQCGRCKKCKEIKTLKST